MREVERRPGALRAVLKRGALVVAANWPIVIAQFVAESLFKTLLAVPIGGAAFLVAVLLGRDIAELLGGGVQYTVASVAEALGSHPAALAAFVAAFAVTLVGGSAFMVLVKGGTVTVLAGADLAAGAIEDEPMRLESLRRTSAFSIDGFKDGARRLFRRYFALGLILMAVYGVSLGLYGFVVLKGYRLASGATLIVGWTFVTALSSGVLVVWMTIVNLAYLLTQIVMAVDGRGVGSAMRQVGRFVRAEALDIAGVFGVVLVLVLMATFASIVAAAGLGLVAFVPVAGLVVLPLQLAAWLLRSMMLQYLGLAALAAYVRLYRGFTGGSDVASGRPRHTTA